MPVGSKLGHFNLLEEIAHGGMGTVYRAFDPTLNREVAIKVLRDELAHDPKFVSDFVREARSAASINHPNIVQVYFVGQEGNEYYLVMELLKGRSLRQIVEQDGPLDEERALDLAIQVAEALRAAYQVQMIHGDIKPANIFSDERAGAKVLDFGLAKLANVEVAAEEGIWGSPYYISPERVGQKAEDFRSDVYSLGASLFHIITGRPPFEAHNPEELALKRLNEKPPLLRDVRKNITVKTEQVVNKMLNKSILMRYRDYDALLEDLRGAKTEATAKRLGVELHPELKRPPPSATSSPKKSPLPLVVTAAVAVLLIVGILTFVFWPKQPPPVTPGPKPAPRTPPPTAVTPAPQPSPPSQPTPPAPTPAPQPSPPTQPVTPPPSTPPSGANYSVEFTFRAPNAKSVYLSGEFNNWSQTATPMRKRGNGEWYTNVPLRPGRYQYKFLADGAWVADPDNPLQAPDPYGGHNSIAVVGQ